MSDDCGRRCGAWTLEREIGRGAAGVVYLATGANGAVAAVKVCLREELGADRYARELRGAKLYQRIPPGEGLVRLLELGECDGGFYTAMELADDEFGAQPGATPEYRPKTLSCVIAGERALSVKESVKLGLALAKGLETLQRHHLLHRDIKPGNVVYVRGCPALSDPGLLVDEAEAASLVGTPGYVPPENFIGAGGDIYSLGLTLKAASFGRPVEELANGPTFEADTESPLFPKWWRILNKATHPDASRRYRSAKALLKDLQSLRRQIAFSIFSWKVPFFLDLAIVGLSLLIVHLIFQVISPSDGGFAKRKAQVKAAAQEVLDKFVDRRVKEDMPNILRGSRATFELLQKMIKDDFACNEKKIAELEKSIAANEARMREAEKQGDKNQKAALEYRLAHNRNLLKQAKERRVELEKDISDNEVELQEYDVKIQHAEKELQALEKAK